MSNIIRVEHSKNYTCIANAAIRDKGLSLKARGLHHVLLSYPDNWKISQEHLASQVSDSDGRTAINTGLKELENLGYITREKKRGADGRITGWEYVVRESPQAGFPKVEFSESGKNRKRKKPLSDNQLLRSNDSLRSIESKEVSSPTPSKGKTDDDDFSSQNPKTKDNPSTPLATSESLKAVSPGRDNNHNGNGRVRGTTLATRSGIPEVRTAQRVLQPLKENFFGDDKPWSLLAAKIGSTPIEIHSLAHRWLAASCRDKKDPKAYIATILSKLASDPNSRYNSVLWMEFEDKLLDRGIESLALSLEASEANRPPDKAKGFGDHPRYDEWMEVLKPGKVGLKKFAEQGEADGSEGVRRDFYKWAKSENLFTFNWG